MQTQSHFFHFHANADAWEENNLNFICDSDMGFCAGGIKAWGGLYAVT